MRHDKLERELQLLLLLTENHNYTVQDVCEQLDISRRNFYYYIEFFQLAGFKVENRKPYYRIRRDSPFFKKMDEIVHFSEDEALTIRNILEQADDKSIQVQRIKQKLDRLYDFNILNDETLRQQTARNVSTIYEAIKLKQCVVLKNYSSPHSNTQKDRVVEPFLFMNGNREIRGFELASGQNKTFKLSRTEEVKMLDLSWANEYRHHQMFTDIFMFSDEQLLPVRMRLNRLSYSLLTEEYPTSSKYITPDGDGCWLLEMNVCSYKGIGRFVMGLYEDIEVLGSEEFRQYLHQKLHNIISLNQKQDEKDYNDNYNDFQISVESTLKEEN